MDFFEHQQRSRRRSRWLVLLFGLAVALTATGVALIVAMLIPVLSGEVIPVRPSGSWLAANRDLLLGSAAITVMFIGLASWIRLVQLRSGGARVAESLGGTRILPEDPDPARRRLYNVVEEMAIASGLPVPAVYVLEREGAINAFAAGRTPSDAAVAVTRGALGHLSREELQGVIGHEFSHILHGDMRLNIRLMGYLFGLMAVNMLGRAMSRVGGRRSVGRRGRGSMAVVLAGVALYVLGYVGVLVGRIIQAAVCRQREFLADASAVQFTRQSEGLAGALRKIAGLVSRSYLRAGRAEEVSHMLFGAGRRTLAGLFATHPPIEQRLAALEPHGPRSAAAALETPRNGTMSGRAVAGVSSSELPSLAAAAVPDRIGNPGDPQLRYAETLPDSLPVEVWQAAHRLDDGLAVVLALMLDGDPAIRSHQLSLIEVRFGAPAARVTERLFPDVSELDSDARLAMFDVVFPLIRNMQPARRAYLLETVERLAELDGRWAPFESALVAMLRSRLRDLSREHRRTPPPRTASEAVASLVSRIALIGHDSRAEAESAFADGMAAAGLSREEDAPSLPSEAPDQRTVQRALELLDSLTPLAKRRVVSALAAAAASDGRIAGSELGLLRAACSALHCPLPPLAGAMPKRG